MMILVGRGNYALGVGVLGSWRYCVYGDAWSLGGFIRFINESTISEARQGSVSRVAYIQRKEKNICLGHEWWENCHV